MNRVLQMVGLIGLLVMVMGGVANAQSSPVGGGGGEVLQPAGEGDGAGGTTPCSTIVISGSSWGPGQQVTVIRNDPGVDGSDGGTCEDAGTSITGLTGQAGTTPQSAPAAAPSADGRTLGTAVAEPDGTFTVAIQVPADAQPGAFSYTLVGKNAEGQDQRVVNELDIVPMDAFTAGPVDGGAPAPLVWQALVVALLAVVILGQLLGGKLTFGRRRSSRA